MRPYVPVLVLGLLAALSELRTARLLERVESLNLEAEEGIAARRHLVGRIEELDRELGASKDELVRLVEGQVRVDELDRALAEADCELDELFVQTHSTLSAQEERLRSFESHVLTPEDLQTRFERWQESLRADWNVIEDTLWTTRDRTREHEQRLKELGRRVKNEPDAMWEAMMAPVVQLAGTSTVGSGILLPSAERDDGSGYVTHVLTAWHVVRDILADDDLVDGPVPVAQYDREGHPRSFTASLLQFDARLDIALLELETNELIPGGAHLPSRERIERTRVFEAIYAVGCPLGNDPIPTRGEVADVEHMVDGERYWMINAPTYIGNSGGAIYDAETFELLGVFSKIYTHGTLRPTVVPHMGLVTPLSDVYDWIGRVGFAALVEGVGTVGSGDEAESSRPLHASASRD